MISKRLIDLMNFTIISNILFIFFLGFSSESIAQNNDAHVYHVNLGDLNVDIGRCAVNVDIEGVGNFQYVVGAPSYSLNVYLNSAQNSNRKLKIKGFIKWGLAPNNAPACNVNSEVYINKLIIDEWNTLKSLSTDENSHKCINLALDHYGEKFEGALDGAQLYLRFNDTKVLKIFDACEKISLIDLKSNVPCTLIDSKSKTTCNEAYYSSNDPNPRKLDFDQAVIAALKGDSILKGAWETQEAESNRMSKIATENMERLRIKKEQEDRQKWLQSTEGKKYLEVEAMKVKKAEEERLKDEARMKKQEDERLRVLNAENRKNPNYQDTSKMRQAFRTYGIANLRLNCHQDETINEQTGQKTVSARFQKEGGIEIAVDNGRGLMKIGSNSFQLTHDRSVRIGLDADRYYIKVYPNTFFRYMELAVSDNGIDLWQQAINYHFIGSCKYK